MDQLLPIAWEIDPNIFSFSNTKGYTLPNPTDYHYFQVKRFLEKNLIGRGKGKDANFMEEFMTQYQLSGTCTMRSLMKFVSTQLNVTNNKRFKAFAVDHELQRLELLQNVSHLISVINKNMESSDHDLSLDKMIKLGNEVLLKRAKKISA